MKRTVTIFTLLVLATAATADERSTATAFMNCARIADDVQRLACYDRLATDLIELGLSQQGSAAPAPAPAAAPPATAAAPTPPPAAPADPAPAPAGVQQTVPAAAAAGTAAAGAAESDFGRERIDGGDKSQADEIRSRYVGEFTGWDGKTIFRLENGQVWQQVRSGRLAWRADSPMITIKRGLMGGYRLSVEGVNKSVYVKRIQ